MTVTTQTDVRRDGGTGIQARRDADGHLNADGRAQTDGRTRRKRDRQADRGGKRGGQGARELQFHGVLSELIGGKFLLKSMQMSRV
jgi:hypothetical protein